MHGIDEGGGAVKHQDGGAAAFPAMKPLPTSRNLRQEEGYRICHECGRVHSAENIDCEQCLTVLKLGAMHVTSRDLQVTDSLCPQQARVEAQIEHAQELSTGSRGPASSRPQPVHAKAPVDYIQESQAPTITVPPEQVEVWEAIAREDPIGWTNAKEEPVCKDHAQAEKHDTVFSQIVEQRFAEVHDSLEPMGTGDLKAFYHA